MIVALAAVAMLAIFVGAASAKREDRVECAGGDVDDDIENECP